MWIKKENKIDSMVKVEYISRFIIGLKEFIYIDER